jgi:hypothetical protein
MIPGVKRACLKCGVLTLHGSWCAECLAKAERIRSRKRGTRHYTGDYRKRAAAVRANAVECWICHEGARPGDPWTADHLFPGDPASALLAAHRSCNSARGDRPADQM